MTDKWTLLEKTAGIVIICLSTYSVYFTTDLLITRLSYFSTTEVLRQYFTSELHLWVLMGFTGVVGGVLLLANRKIGWLTSITAFFSYFLILFIGVLFRNNHSNAESIWYWTFIGALILLLFLFGALLSNNYFRRKYSANQNNFLLVVVVLLLILADKILIN